MSGFKDLIHDDAPPWLRSGTQPPPNPPCPPSAPEPPEEPPRDNPELVRRWLDFHAENPHIAEAFDKLAWVLIGRGRKRISHGTIIERIRWDMLIGSTDEEFKINQNFGAFYARRFMAKHPGHDDLFERRSSCADTVDMALVP